MAPELEPPTLGEVMRRLEEVSKQLAEVIREIKEDRVAAASTYVRQDVYIAQRQADSAVLADLHSDISGVQTELRTEIASINSDHKSDLAWRRQVLLWLGGITVTVLLGIAGLLASILGS